MSFIDIDDMRRFVSNKYPGIVWKAKVQRMPDCQIMAIFYRMIEDDEKPNKTKKHAEKSPDKEVKKSNTESSFTPYSGTQIVLDGWL